MIIFVPFLRLLYIHPSYPQEATKHQGDLKAFPSPSTYLPIWLPLQDSEKLLFYELIAILPQPSLDEPQT